MDSTFVMTVFEFLNEKNLEYTAERRLYALLLCAKKRLDMKNHDNRRYEILRRWNEWFHKDGDSEEYKNMIFNIVDKLALPPFQEQYLKHYLTDKTWNYLEMEREIIIISGESFLLNEREVCNLLGSLREN